MSVAVLVPLKGFAAAKGRLAEALDGDARAALARRLAAGVVAAAHPLPVFLATDDKGVAAWAVSVDAEVLWTPGLGLTAAVADGVARLAAAGHSRVVVAQGDLARPHAFSPLSWFAGVTLVPDRHGDGTNVACVPAAAGFGFAYGPGSFARHYAEARRLGLAVRVHRDDDLAWDVDVPDDLIGVPGMAVAPTP